MTDAVAVAQITKLAHRLRDRWPELSMEDAVVYVMSVLYSRRRL